MLKWINPRWLHLGVSPCVSPPNLAPFAEGFLGLGRQEGGIGEVLGGCLVQTSLALCCFESVVSSLPARWCLETFQRPQPLPRPITATAQTGFNVCLRVPPTFPLSR